MKAAFKVSTAILLLILPFFAFAHQPRMIKGQEAIKIENPEISQAFYAVLDSKPQIYEIESGKPFVLFVGLLAPQIKNASTTKDFSAFIYQRTDYEPKLLSILAGPKFQWAEFHEPFANDDYFKGPEFRQEVGAGKYFIKIVSPCHSDFASTLQDCGPEKYVLAIGEKEELTLKEIIETLRVLPQEKKFFNKSVLTVLVGRIGLYFFLLAVIIIIIGLIIWLVVKFIRSRRRQ